MARVFSLAHLTVPGLRPPEMATIAGGAGFTHIGLRMTPVTPGGWCFPLMDDPALFRETKLAMAAAGVRLLDVEVLRLAPDIDVSVYEPLLAISAELGAQHMLTQIHYDDDEESDSALQAFSDACDLAGRYGLSCDLEFLPWTRNHDLETASDFVRGAGKSNAGILVDTLHFNRSFSDPTDLGSLPPEWFRFVQLCDAPAKRPDTLEGLLFHAREARDFPGQGGLDLDSVLRALPENIPIALEIPNTSLGRVLSVEDRVTRALSATKTFLAKMAEDDSDGRRGLGFG